MNHGDVGNVDRCNQGSTDRSRQGNQDQAPHAATDTGAQTTATPHNGGHGDGENG